MIRCPYCEWVNTRGWGKLYWHTWWVHGKRDPDGYPREP